MPTLAQAIATAITKTLLTKLPEAVANKYKKIDEDDFKDFLTEFLTTELKSAKGGKGGPKGKNGKGRISGYLLFGNANRDKVKEDNPDYKFGEVGKELGNMWKDLTEKEQSKWNTKAAKQNEANGIAPAAKKAPAKKTAGKKTTGKKTAGKKAPPKKETPAKKAPAKKGSAEKETAIKLARNKEAKAWVIQGTNFVVQSPKEKVVIGKLKGNKVVELSATDKKTCASKGWAIKTADKPAKKTSAKKEKEQEPADDSSSSGDDSGSGSGSGSGEGDGDQDGSNDDDSN